MPYIKIKQWLTNNPVLNKLLRNAGKLFSGDFIASILGFVSVALTARSLGPESYGILVLIQAYTLVIDKLVNFQSWQALIKYGSEAIENQKYTDFDRLVKFGTLIDSGSAVLGTMISVLGAFVIGTWFNWDREIINMTIIYSAVILFNIIGTPTAILRLNDKFGAFAIQKVLAATIKLVGILFAYFNDFGLSQFVIVYILTEIIGHIILLYMGWREIGLNRIFWVLSKSRYRITETFPGIWSYVWSTNLSGAIAMISRRLDIIIVGGVLGPAATGLYDIAKKFGGILNKFQNPLYQTIYPELSKLWNNGDKKAFINLGIQTASLAGVFVFIIWGIFVLFGNWIIEVSFGDSYSGAHKVVIWYLLAVVIEIIGFPLQPAMLAMGYPKKSLIILTFSTAIYLIILFPLLGTTGIIGAGLAYLVYYLNWTLLMLVTEIKILNLKESTLLR